MQHPKQQNWKDIGPGIYQDLLQPRAPCTANLCAVIGIFDPHLLILNLKHDKKFYFKLYTYGNHKTVQTFHVVNRNMCFKQWKINAYQ